MVFILMKCEYAKSFLLTFNLLSIKIFGFNNQVLNVLTQNSSEIREIKTKPAFVFISLLQFSYHNLAINWLMLFKQTMFGLYCMWC